MLIQFSLLFTAVLGDRFLAASVVNDTCYGVMLDCGSTSTKTSIYSWPCRTSISYPNINIAVQAPSLKTSPGISVQTKATLATYLTPILTFVNNNVPAAQKSITPIFMGATAGMRLLDINIQNVIIDQLRSIFNSSGFLFEQTSWARVIAGQDEAMYMWLSTNYLLNSTASNTVATIDLGGASTQIAYTTANQSFDSNILSITTPYPQTIFAISYLKYGVDQARQAVVLMSSSFSTQISTPCYPSGYSNTWADNNTYTITGTGDYIGCMNLISQYLGSSCSTVSGELCGLLGVEHPAFGANTQIYGLTAVSTLATFFGVTNFTLNSLYPLVQQYCSMSWSQIQANSVYAANPYSLTNYFLSVYVYQLLSIGFNIPLNQTVYSPSTISSQTPTWGLAGVQYQLAAVSCYKDSPFCAGSMMPIVILLILILK